MNDPSLIGFRAALTAFVNAEKHQSQEHIKPLHEHIAARLVINGGFHPNTVMPHPPLRVDTTGKGSAQKHYLVLDKDVARSGEQTILGGLKTKSVDVVVSTRETGPSLAVSVKGSLNAFRNLTNRMEEAAGDCTNLHLTYPTMIYGFFHVIRANREEDVAQRNDIAVHDDGTVAEDIRRYHDAMVRLTNRSDIRNDASRYEAIALALVSRRIDDEGLLLDGFPIDESPLRFQTFFESLYHLYDLRFVYSAPSLARVTKRLEWESDSPALENSRDLGFSPRTSGQ